MVIRLNSIIAEIFYRIVSRYKFILAKPLSNCSQRTQRGTRNSTRCPTNVERSPGYLIDSPSGLLRSQRQRVGLLQADGRRKLGDLDARVRLPNQLGRVGSNSIWKTTMVFNRPKANKRHLRRQENLRDVIECNYILIRKLNDQIRFVQVSAADQCRGNKNKGIFSEGAT